MKIGSKTIFSLKFIGTFVLALGLCFVFNYSREFDNPWDLLKERNQVAMSVNAEDSISLIANGKAIVVDARDPFSFAEGHIPHSLNITKDHSTEKISEILKDVPNDQLIIVYCDGSLCNKSEEVAHNLKLAGFDNLVIFIDGIDGWISAGKDLEVE